MMARGREPPAGDPAYPARRERAPPGPPLVTLQQLRDQDPWVWLVCRNPACGRSVPIAVVPLIIRWGPLEEVDRLRGSAVCRDCGQRGATLSKRSWHDPMIGNAPRPARFVTDEHGITVELNRPTHYHDGRPMAWWLKQQRGT
jgi:hypothetical protein